MVASGHDIIDVLRVDLDMWKISALHCDLEQQPACPLLEDLYVKVKKFKKPNDPGHDFFVLRRSVFEKIVARLGDVFLGYPPVGTEMKCAMECLSGHRIVS